MSTRPTPAPAPAPAAAPCRNWLLPVMRVAVCLVPSARQVGVGTALLLERPPQPGIRGLLHDLLRGVTGEVAPAGGG